MFDKECRFESQRLTFRGIGKEDTDNLVRWRSQEDVYRYSNNPNPISLSDHISWFGRYIKNAHEIRTIITERKACKDIGMVGGILKDEVFEISYYIGEPKYRGKGYAGEAINALIEFVQNVIEDLTIHAQVNNDNTASISCLHKTGFTLLERAESTSVYAYLSKRK